MVALKGGSRRHLFLIYFKIPDTLLSVEKISDCSDFVNKELIQCAPIKSFPVKPGFKPGLTKETQELMRERDDTRKKIHKASPSDKKILHEKKITSD